MAKGDQQTGGRRRSAPKRERIAARAAQACQCEVRHPEGVQPLNAGFFALEGMRQANVAQLKARKVARGKVRGK